MPQGFNVTGFRTGCTAHRLVPVDRFFCFFDIPDFRVQRRRLPSWIFSTSRLCSPLVPSTFDPAFDLVFAYVSMCLLSLATISPACPTTWRPPNCGEIVFLLEVCFVCRLGSITAASGRFPPFRLPNRGDTVPSGVFGVSSFFLSITTDSAHLLSFRRPNRDDIRIFWVRSACTPPPATADSVCLHSFRLSNRGYIVILVAFVPYLILTKELVVW